MGVWTTEKIPVQPQKQRHCRPLCALHCCSETMIHTRARTHTHIYIYICISPTNEALDLFLKPLGNEDSHVWFAAQLFMGQNNLHRVRITGVWDGMAHDTDCPNNPSNLPNLFQSLKAFKLGAKVFKFSHFESLVIRWRLGFCSL